MNRKSILLLACCLVVVGLAGCAGKEGPMGPEGPAGVTLIAHVPATAAIGGTNTIPIPELNYNNKKTFVHVYYQPSSSNEWLVMADGDGTGDDSTGGNYYSVNWQGQTVKLYRMFAGDLYSIDVFQYN